MKGSDKAIVLGVVMAIVLAGFYFKELAPKRDKASSLKQDIATLSGQIEEQKQKADYAEDARQHFPVYYSRIVALGKAAPGQADTASLLVQLNTISHRNHVSFDALQLSAESGDTASTSSTSSSASGSTPPGATGTETTGTSTTGTSTPSATTPTSTSTAATTAPAPATEADAASLPIGAAVGSAGLPTMPYKLKFTGTFFDAADFLQGIDDLVHPSETTGVSADGRLLTIDGFVLKLPEESGGPNPQLHVNLAVTSYVTPSAQGLTAGATPGGPAPTTITPPAQPASSTVTP